MNLRLGRGRCEQIRGQVSSVELGNNVSHRHENVIDLVWRICGESTDPRISLVQAVKRTSLRNGSCIRKGPWSYDRFGAVAARFGSERANQTKLAKIRGKTTFVVVVGKLAGE
jgi:hypothetical protein